MSNFADNVKVIYDFLSLSFGITLFETIADNDSLAVEIRAVFLSTLVIKQHPS